MKLSTGKKAFPIEFDNGEKETIFFNPNDPNLAIRLNAAGEKIQEKINELPEPEENESAELEGYKKVQEIIYNELDDAFGGDISSKVFKYCSPFAIVDGEFFISQFMRAIIPEVTKEINKAQTNLQKKMQKHLEKYN
jgi:hypothetical protein